ncbi:heavy metal translocating P-type ATPase [Leeia sp.]|uniref:heavy metal translocating P-type ATPase n=1 Tax=Leeia sp. TaxID=2884678 RepID=UPI0035B49E24
MSELCYHCQLPVPAGADFPIRLDSGHAPACCAGCQAVAQTILDSGMGVYYRQRSEPAGKADPLPDSLRQQLLLYDDPLVQQDFVHPSDQHPELQEAQLLLEGITCAACVWLNEQTVRRLPGVHHVSINYSSYRAVVRWDPAQVRLSDILQAISLIGYRAHPFDASRQAAQYQQERKTALRRVFVAGFGMMQVMMYAWPAYFSDRLELPLDQDVLMRWASLLLTLPVVLYSAWPFYLGSWRDLKSGRMGMDVPVTLGILGAFLPSVWATVSQHGAVYFDSVTMFVFLLQGGRYLELTARRKASESADSLSRLLPAFAHHLPHWPQPEVVEQPLARLEVGDHVLVKPGETIPVDGEVVDGDSLVVEALLTGESTPLPRQPGDRVVGGSLNQHNPLVIRATQVRQTTRLAGIVRLLEQALGEKPRMAELANRFAHGFVLLILLVAIATAFYWGRHDPAQALWVTVSVLVITCPCALSLAVPVALTAATGQLARLGVLVGRGHALTTLPQVTQVVFDKTGTLTLGELSVARAHYFAAAAEVQPLLVSLESRSEHPVARALLRHAGSHAALPLSDYDNQRGQGVSAVIAGQRYWLGRPEYAAPHCSAPCPTEPEHAVWLASCTQWLAAFELSDTLRPDAQATVQALQRAGLRVTLASGDQRGPVAHIAHSLGISDWYASLSPEDKLALIRERQQAGEVVMMVGDGVNDAPVLAQAQLSVAMASGADLARHSADMILNTPQLWPLYQGWQLASQTRRIMRQNLLWGFCYNGIAIPLAVLGHVTPFIAGIGMAGSSLLVVLNALRLLRRNAVSYPPAA